MTTAKCPPEVELLRLVDAQLPPEQQESLEAHLRGCQRCREATRSLRQLCAELGAPVALKLDVPAHVAAVMARIDSVAVQHSVPTRRGRRWGSVSAFLAMAAGIALWLNAARQSKNDFEAQDVEGLGFQARGGKPKPGVAHGVRVQAYSYKPELHPLQAGESIGRLTPLTAGYRNLQTASRYLLLFTIDADNDVRWISPPFKTAGEDPEAVELQPVPQEKLLETSVVLEDLKPGRLRVVSIIASAQLHVSDVESLRPAELTLQGLRKKFEAAEVREFLVNVHATPSSEQ